MLRKAPGGPFVCTATMVAPNLALTARHCVSDADETLNCRLDGTASAGGTIHSDAAPADLSFFVGPNAPARDALPSAIGARVIHDRAGNLCSHDLAFVLLDRALDTPIAPMRLAEEPVPGEAVRVIGWGLVKDDPPTPTTVRRQRDVNVKHVGPKDLPDQFLTLTATDFGLGESICLGDSGGPVLARDNGAIIGVISHGSGCFGGGDGGLCAVGSDATDAASAVLFSAFFLWARRRRLFAR
jgi:hypothetical protein